MATTKFEVRQIDAWATSDGWEYNQTFKLFDFNCKSSNETRSFRRALNRHGITLTPKCETRCYDGDTIEVNVRRTQEPLFVAIPVID